MGSGARVGGGGGGSYKIGIRCMRRISLPLFFFLGLIEMRSQSISVEMEK